MTTPIFADDWHPLPPEEHDRQLAGVLDLLGPPARRVIDLGAGGGRVAGPLARAGHDVLAIDADPEAVRSCEQQGARARAADLRNPSADLSHPAGPADAILCLGHTFNLLADPDATLMLMRRLPDLCAPAAWLAIDDSPHSLWSEVSSGDWQEGLSEDGAMQMVWAPGDNVIALREGDDVDKSDWSVREGDRPIRLWSWGELRLLGAASGWGGPIREESRGLVLFRRVARP